MTRPLHPLPHFHGFHAHWLDRIFLLTCLFVFAGCQKTASDNTRLSEGQAFPLITLTTGTGAQVGVESMRGKLVVLNIWATWCSPCRKEMPALERLSRELDPRRFAVIGLSTDRDRWLAQEFLLKNGISFANFFDSDGDVARRLELKVYPETFLISPDGKLVRRVPGLREWDSPEIIAELEDAYRQSQGMVDKQALHQQ